MRYIVGGFIALLTVGGLAVAQANRVLQANSLRLEESGGPSGVTLQAPSLSADYTLTLPSAQGAASTLLKNNGSGGLSFGLLSNANVATDAAIDATKIGGGAVSSTEFGYLDGVTSGIQTQLDGKQAESDELTSLSGLAAVGLVARVDEAEHAVRTIEAGSAKLTVTDGDGALGNPTIDVDEAELTLDNLGGTLSIDKGGTGETTAAAAFDALAPTSAKGDLVAYDGAGNVRFPVGSDGLVLAADSSADSGLAWVSALSNPMDAEGDLIVGGVDGAPEKLAVGASGTVLKGGMTPTWAAISNGDVASDAAIEASKLDLASALTIGPASSDSTAHTVRGSIATGTAIPSFSFDGLRYVGSKHASYLHRTNATAGSGGFLYSGIYFDGTSNKRSAANLSGSFFAARTQSTTGSEAFGFYVDPSVSHSADSAASASTIGTATVAGAWTLGPSGSTATHTVNGAVLDLVRAGDTTIRISASSDGNASFTANAGTSGSPRLILQQSGTTRSLIRADSTNAVEVLAGGSTSVFRVSQAGAVTIPTGGGNVPNACTRRSESTSGSSSVVSCNTGEIALGGGCDSSGSSTAYVRASYPSSTTQWTCVFGNSAPTTTTAYAICCRY